MYFWADPAEKLSVIDFMTPPNVQKGQFSAADSLIDIIKGLWLWGVDLMGLAYK